MDNFIFSINATFPIFIVILLGYILRKINLLTEEFANVANKYVFVVALPVMLFKDIASSDLSDMNLKFFLFCFIVTVLMFLLVWLIAIIFIKDKTMIGAFAQVAARGSAAVLGVAFVENICGDSGMAALMIIAAVPYFNILSVIILVVNSNEPNDNQSGKIKSSLVNIAKNPIIIGILLGLVVALIKLPIYTIPDMVINYVGRTATPIALLAIGASFKLDEALVRLKPALGATFIKLIGLPLLFLPIAYYMGFKNGEMVAILIMLASPSTVSGYVMAKNMHNDEVLTSNAIVLTTLLSSVTITLWVFILRTIGCI